MQLQVKQLVRMHLRACSDRCNRSACVCTRARARARRERAPLQVNGQNVVKVGHRQVVNMIRQGGNSLVLKVVMVTRHPEAPEGPRRRGTPPQKKWDGEGGSHGDPHLGGWG